MNENKNETKISKIIEFLIFFKNFTQNSYTIFKK